MIDQVGLTRLRFQWDNYMSLIVRVKFPEETRIQDKNDFNSNTAVLPRKIFGMTKFFST
jgi:hypothetical protein